MIYGGDMANDDIWTIAFEPGFEACFRDLRSDEGRHLIGLGPHAEERLEGCRPFALDAIIFPRFETKTDSAVAAFGETFE